MQSTLWTSYCFTMHESPSTCSTRRRNSVCTSQSRLPRSSPFSAWRSFGARGFCPCRHTLRERRRRLGNRNKVTFGGSCRGGGGCRSRWQRGCGWRDQPVEATHKGGNGRSPSPSTHQVHSCCSMSPTNCKVKEQNLAHFFFTLVGGYSERAIKSWST